MALIGMADNNIDIPVERDGAMYNVMLGNQNFVISNIGNEFEATYASNSFVVTIGTGEGIICGRHVVEETEGGANSSIQLDANDTGYLVIRFDLTQPSGSEVYLATATTPYEQNLNGAGTMNDLVLYQYITGANGVTSMTDVRKRRSSVSTATSVSGTLLASGWSSNVYTFSSSAITTGKQIAVTCPPSASDVEYNTYINAVIRITAVSDGQITLKAMRVQPTRNLPIEFVFLG